MNVKQLSILADVSVRQVQRWIGEGYHGQKLPAVKVGHSFVIERKAYEAWRRECGLDLPVVQPQACSAEYAEPTPAPDLVVPEVVPEPAASCAERPAFRAADPSGPLTNVPHPASSNFPHPDVIRQHTEQAARDLNQRYRDVDE